MHLARHSDNRLLIISPEERWRAQDIRHPSPGVATMNFDRGISPPTGLHSLRSHIYAIKQEFWSTQVQNFQACNAAELYHSAGY
jgi:hypothetical protein